MLVIQFLHGYMVLLYHLYANTHYACRGGYSQSNTICGIFSISVDHIITWIYWLVGTALSLLHIMLFVVEILVMINGVDFFLSVVIPSLLGHIGIVVLLYRLKLIHIILLMVVLLPVVSVVDHSLLVPTLLLVLLTGLVVLLYHVTSYYSLRGAVSRNGAACGAFAVYALSSVGDYSWAFGAALL